MTDSNRPLTEQERALRAKYLREWRSKNKDKVSGYNKAYWQRRAAREAARGDKHG